MDNEKIIEVVNYLGAENILLTLMPALLINIMVDMTKHLLNFKTKSGQVVALNGLLSFLGFIFGIIYFFALDIKFYLALVHSLVICFLSYTFYKLQIYELLKKIVLTILKKFGVETRSDESKG